MHMCVLYSEYLTCMYIYLCEKVQNTLCFIYSSFRDLQYESFLQRAISVATTQKEWNPLQEQKGFLRMNGVALYGRHDAPPSSYTTEPRHRAFVNGATTK